MNRKLFACLVIFVCLAAGFGLTFTHNSSTAEAQATQTLDITTAPLTLDGHYHQTKNDIRNTSMSADISGNTIRIEMTLNGEKGHYWVGSFNPGDDITKSFEVVSNVNSDELSGSLFRSKDQTKTFTYQDGDLSFEFTIRGMKTVVHLSRD